MSLDETRERAEEIGSEDGSNGGGRGLLSKDVLIPAAATAVTAAAAGIAAKKGPDLMKKITGSAEGEAEKLGREGAEGAKEALGRGTGGRLAAAGKVASKLIGGGGGAQSGGETRRLPIQRWTDIAVPVEEAYEGWTNFEEFPKFMHRVLEVKQEDDDKIHWREKIWFSTREWEGEITDKRKNDRIAWKSVSGTQHSGVISFHRLDRNLTRVLVTVDFVPSGMIEKMASGMRFVKRAVEADLARFKAYVELANAKGLEYRSGPQEMEQHRQDGADAEDKQGRSEDQPKSEGDGDSPESGEDEERESQRQEREKRRKERQEALSSS